MAYKFNLKNNPELAAERHRASNRAYYARNREKVLARHAEWRKQNPGYDAQFMRDKREQNEASRIAVGTATDTGSSSAD